MSYSPKLQYHNPFLWYTHLDLQALQELCADNFHVSSSAGQDPSSKERRERDAHQYWALILTTAHMRNDSSTLKGQLQKLVL